MFTVGTSIRLWCLIGRDNFIIDLKEIIKNRKQNKFAKVDFDQLILWKVNIDQSQIKTTSINDILNDEDKLENSELTVVKTFPNTKGNNVKVIIGVPALVDTIKELLDTLPMSSKLGEPEEWYFNNRNKAICLNHHPPSASNTVPVILHCLIFEEEYRNKANNLLSKYLDCRVD
ncbi:hypothetical protein RhiirA5_429825 [Rhizophagus irregularis]|uniref:Crinkler effector protein N-terminal domain-containing protein n=1 Tax=Rhizophagus irregularis TaxID=588596 RepID=A0A2N0NXR1_9GLOM|nr:hypothetical protein RhiirA5_429825 [Rhizophagus irregularis]